MNRLDDVLKRLDTEGLSAAEQAVTARTAVMTAFGELIAAAGAELPENDSFVSRLSSEPVALFFTVRTELTHAANYVRILGGNARNSKRIKRAEAALAIDHAKEIVWAVKAKLSGKSLTYKRTMSEAETRKQYIDVFLEEAGWEVSAELHAVYPSKACVEIGVDGMPPAGGTGYCDYVLFGPDGKPLAVVEAKRTSVNVDKGRVQVRCYGDCLERKYNVKPVLYFTNGYEIWVDDRIYPERPVVAFHSLEELQRLRYRQERGKIDDIRPNPNIAGRYYQTMAIKVLCERFNRKFRHGLLVMATGTGKTRTAVSLVDVLTRHDWIENILFLADRTELVKQAYDSFSGLLPDMTYRVLSAPSLANDPNARITLSTYQTLIRSIDSDEKQFTSGAFDLVIVDEAHRSIFNKYGILFDYFDALQVGLTATPREQVDASTYEKFRCDQGVPDYDYPIEQGFKDNYLKPWKLINRTTDVMRDGIVYDELSASEKSSYERGFDEAGRDAPAAVAADDVFRLVYNRTTCAKVLDDLMSNGLRVESGDLLGKTIIFAVNHEHADLIVRVFRELYPELAANDYCQLIDNKVNRAGELITDFKTQPKFRIAVSVDMLDTGIDVPELLNVAYFKKVRSKIKFYQMLGRGTRTCPDLFGPGKDKECFYAFDYCGNFDYFMLGGEGQEELDATLSVSQRIFLQRVRLMHELQSVKQQSIPARARYWSELNAVVYEQLKAVRACYKRISVRKVLPVVDKWQDEDRLKKLDERSIRELSSVLAPLVTALDDSPEVVRLFDLKMLTVQLAIVASGSALAAKDQVLAIRTVAKELLKYGTLDEVKAKAKDIELTSSAEFWKAASVEEVERLRKSIRDLVQLIKKTAQGVVYMSVSDEVIDKPTPAGIIDFKTYRERIIDYLLAHSESAAVQKLAHLDRLDARDLEELERVLWEELGTRDDFDRAKDEAHHDGSIAAFLRTLIGVDEDAVMEKFGAFLLDKTFNSRQQEFIQSIVDYLRENGEVTVNDLLDKSPFKYENLQMIFEGRQEDLQKIIAIIRETFPTAA